MIPTNVLELALRDPSRRTADLAGRTRHPAHAAHVRRGAHRLIARRRPARER